MKRNTSPRRRARLWSRQGVWVMTESVAHVRVIEETSAYWRVLFENPPFNIVDATIFEGLQDLLARMDASPSLRVVVFESANPEFYLAHFDLTGKTGNITTAVGPSGLPILMDTFVRLTKSPVVSIAKIRGCVRGVSSEFVLACDMRFASRENTATAPTRSRGGSESRRRRYGTPATAGRPRPCARNRSRSERLRRRHRGTIRIRQPGTSGRGAGRLRRRARAPDRVFRSASYRGGEESHEPSLVAIRRPAPRRPQRVSDRADVARSAAANPSSVKGRTPTGRRLREAVACAARYTPRDVVIVWRSAASPNWQINRANHHNIETAPNQRSDRTPSAWWQDLYPSSQPPNHGQGSLGDREIPPPPLPILRIGRRTAESSSGPSPLR